MKLSIEAKAVFFGAFLSPKATLTFQNVQSVPSPKARSGLDELVTAGLLARTDSGLAESYSLTDAGKNIDRREIDPAPFAFMQKHGKFPMAVPKA